MALSQCFDRARRRQTFGGLETDMELLDRYIRLLRLFLPRRQREDIAREISEEIR